MSVLKPESGLTAVRAAAAIACLLGLSSSLPAASIILGVTADSKLVQINPLTGAGSPYVTLDGDFNPLGIAWNGTSLYLFGQNNGDLRKVNDLTTGATTELATPLASLPSTGGFVPTKGDVTYNGGNFYIGSSALADGSFSLTNGSLFSVADATGYTGSLVDSGSFPKVGGLAFNAGGTMFGISQFGDTLFTLNAATGATTSSTATSGLDPTTDTVGGLVFAPGGTLYASVSPAAGQSEWFSINPATGAATDVGSIGGYDIVGLAVVQTSTVNPPPIPEPGSFVLFGTGVALVALSRRRRASI